MTLKEVPERVFEGMTWKAWVQIIGLIFAMSLISGGADAESNTSARHAVGHVGLSGLGTIASFLLGKIFR